MTRIVAPSKQVAETIIGGKKYNPGKNGLYEVSNPAHVKAMKSEGFFEASLNPISVGDSTKGFTCVECGFNGWFRKCGRCGHEASAESNPPRDGE